MDKLKELYLKSSREYNQFIPHHESCLRLVSYCHQKLTIESALIPFGIFCGKPDVQYSVFTLGDSVSRPIRSDLYIVGEEQFIQEHELVLGILRDPGHAWTVDDYDKANRVVYTAVMAFSACIDLWQRDSRKTPGTFFEVFMAGLLQSVFPDAIFSKHIPLVDILRHTDVEGAVTETQTHAASDPEANDEDASISTDVVMGVRGKHGGIVIPLKITTRERIVQPFAHQRILDAAFGVGRFKSLIVCISETQLDRKKKKVNQICVPGTIKLFQKYLAPIYGLYYCDLPQRYGAKDMEGIMKVKSVGHLFEDIRTILSKITPREEVKAD